MSWRSVIVLSVCYISTSDSSSPCKFKLQFSPCFWFGVIVFLTARVWFTVLFLMCCGVGSTGQGQCSHARCGKRWMMCLYITWQSLCWLDIFHWGTFNPIFHCICLWGHGSSALCNRDIALDGKGHVDEVITQLQRAEDGFQCQTLSWGGWNYDADSLKELVGCCRNIHDWLFKTTSCSCFGKHVPNYTLSAFCSLISFCSASFRSKEYGLRVF